MTSWKFLPFHLNLSKCPMVSLGGADFSYFLLSKMIKYGIVAEQISICPIPSFFNIMIN